MKRRASAIVIDTKHNKWKAERLNFIFLLTGLHIYRGEYKALGPTLCPTEGRALRGPR